MSETRAATKNPPNVSEQGPGFFDVDVLDVLDTDRKDNLEIEQV